MNRIDIKFSNVWFHMPKRCFDKQAKSYKYYARNGVKILWKSFTEFKEDMYASYLEHIKRYGLKNTSIDRINSRGNYSKDNCRWATDEIQRYNRRNTVILEVNGVKETLLFWSKKTGLSTKRLRDRKFKGWSDEEIVSPLSPKTIRAVVL